jgi:hypothetical protein
MGAVDKALRNAFGLSMTQTGRLRLERRPRMDKCPRSHGWQGVGWLDAVWQGATHIQKAQRLCVLVLATSE